MPILANELKLYGSANMQETDGGSPQGGAIDTSVQIIFDDATLANTVGGIVKVFSSENGDNTQTVTITGRNINGSIKTDIISLTGTTPASGVQSFDRILKIVVSGAHTGTISITDNLDVVIVTIPTGILTVRRPFYNAAALDAERNFYEKVFIKNTNADLDLLSATVKEYADPSAKITFALETAQNGSGTSTNRVTAPEAGVGAFDNTDKAVPGTDLGASAAIGVWLKLTLAASEVPAKTTYTLQVTGNTT